MYIHLVHALHATTWAFGKPVGGFGARNLRNEDEGSPTSPTCWRFVDGMPEMKMGQWAFDKMSHVTAMSCHLIHSRHSAFQGHHGS